MTSYFVDFMPIKYHVNLNTEVPYHLCLSSCLMACQPLWVILCYFPEKERKGDKRASIGEEKKQKRMKEKANDSSTELHGQQSMEEKYLSNLKI